MFEMVKAEMQRRASVKTEAVGSSRYTSKYPFSGMLICGECGSKLRRHTRRVGSGKVVPAFGCANRIVNGRAVCDSHHVNEDVIERTYLAAIRSMAEDADEIIEAVRESAQLVMEPENASALEAVQQDIIEIQEAVLELHKAKQRMAVTEADYVAQIQSYKERMAELESLEAELKSAEIRYAEVSAWLETFAEHTKNSDSMNADDGVIIKALVDHIIINEESMEIHFKCGASIEQAYER
jgi:hypothetical protein